MPSVDYSPYTDPLMSAQLLLVTQCSRIEERGLAGLMSADGSDGVQTQGMSGWLYTSVSADENETRVDSH